MDVLNETLRALGEYLPKVIPAIVIFVLGLLAAWIISGVVFRVLRRVKLGDWVGERTGKEVKAERWIARGVFWLIFLFVIVGVLAVLRLPPLSASLQQVLDMVLGYLPRVLAAAILALVAWLLASGLRFIVSKALKATDFDKRFSKYTELPEERKPAVSETLGSVAYWGTLLLFLPAILGALAMEGILEPVEVLVQKIAAFLPNILVAAAILLVGWFLARIVRKVVASFLAAVGTDKLSEKTGLSGVLKSSSLSNLLGLVVYVLILIPVAIAALEALQLTSLTTPASNMLQKTLAASPLVFGAVLLVALAYIVGRLVARLVAGLLAAVNFNALPAKLGLGKEVKEGKWTPAEIGGHLVLVAILFFASLSALNLLGFESLAGVLTNFLFFVGHILMGLVIFAVGLYLANLAAKVIQSRDVSQAKLLSGVARIAILLLAGAMALRQMGLANEIISLAFGLILGAAAIAVAIAFGIGGRDLAARKLDEWTKSIESKKQE